MIAHVNGKKQLCGRMDQNKWGQMECSIAFNHPEWSNVQHVAHITVYSAFMDASYDLPIRPRDLGRIQQDMELGLKSSFFIGNILETPAGNPKGGRIVCTITSITLFRRRLMTDQRGNERLVDVTPVSRRKLSQTAGVDPDAFDPDNCNACLSECCGGCALSECEEMDGCIVGQESGNQVCMPEYPETFKPVKGPDGKYHYSIEVTVYPYIETEKVVAHGPG